MQIWVVILLRDDQPRAGLPGSIGGGEHRGLQRAACKEVPGDPSENLHINDGQKLGF